jgi:acyl carrier protein
MIEIKKIIREAAEELNETLPEESKLDLDADEPLFGSNSKLDSLGLINFLIVVEQKLEDINISNANLVEQIYQENRRFNSFNTLADFIEKNK